MRRNCTDCILDGTDACSRGAGRAVDDKICGDFFPTKVVEVDDDIVRKSIEYYGMDLQLNVAIEEMSELTKEICKHIRGKENRAEIVEEMADVFIMLANLQSMFYVSERELNRIITEKQERLKNRMEGEEV